MFEVIVYKIYGISRRRKVLYKLCIKRTMKKAGRSYYIKVSPYTDKLYSLNQIFNIVNNKLPFTVNKITFFINY